MSDAITRALELVTADPIDLDALEQLLDAASHDERVAVIRRFSPKIQRRLFEAVEGRSVAVDQIVPADRGPLEEVIHVGQNTLPMFRSFQKRFCRPSADYATDRDYLIGYNHQTFAPLTGPGYFVAYGDDDSGEVWIDYRELPNERPEAWPTIIDNKRRLGRFVYYGMVDKLRRVSEHMTIGRAYKGDAMNAWFVLTRKD